MIVKDYPLNKTEFMRENEISPFSKKSVKMKKEQ